MNAVGSPLQLYLKMAFLSKCHFVIALLLLFGVALLAAGFPSGEAGDHNSENATFCNAKSDDADTSGGKIQTILLNRLYSVFPLIRLGITGMMPEHWNIIDFILEAFLLGIPLYIL